MRRYQVFARPGSRYSRRLNHNRANIVAHFATRSRLSAPGQSRRFDDGAATSGLPPKGHRQTTQEARFVPSSGQRAIFTELRTSRTRLIRVRL